MFLPAKMGSFSVVEIIYLNFVVRLIRIIPILSHIVNDWIM